MRFSQKMSVCLIYFKKPTTENEFQQTGISAKTMAEIRGDLIENRKGKTVWRKFSPTPFDHID